MTLRVEDEDPKKFFCSQMMMYMLKTQKLFTVKDVNINHMKPDDVYAWLQQEMNQHEEEETCIKEDEEQINEQFTSTNVSNE